MTYDEKAETVCLEFASELAAGEAVISFNYTGCLNDQMRGFYRSKYVVDGEERYAAVTQFEVITSHSTHTYCHTNLSLSLSYVHVHSGC